MNVKISRNYNGSDTRMLQSSRIMREMFLRDKELFIKVDAGFADPFADLWAAAIDEAGTDPDIIFKHQLAVKTEEVKEVMSKCHAHYRNTRYFVKKAFNGSSTMLNLFGNNGFERVRFSADRTIGFMKRLSAAVLKYGAELSAAGYPPEYLAMADALWRELEEAVWEKEMYRKERGTLAEERVIKLNLCREYCVRVNSASRIVFTDSWAKLKIFEISQGTQTKINKEVVEESMAI